MFESLEQAKVGDRLFIEGTNVPARLDTVIEITKAGNIKSENNGIFDKRGDADRFYRVHARVATALDIEAVRRRNKQYAIKAYKLWDSLSDADLDIVLNVIKKYKS
jgi:hypothetical protein